MYICSCLALTDRDVNAAIEDGATCPSAVYESCGSKPDCGRCVQRIVAMLKKDVQNQAQP